MNKKLLVASALAAAVAAPSLVWAQKPVPAPTAFKTEKCYGLAKAGQNDCASTGNNSCGGSSRVNADPKAWIYVPEGYCDRIVGGSKTAQSLIPQQRRVAMISSSKFPVPSGAGVGLRLPHIAEVVATLPTVPWLEIHPENFLANPHATELLFEARKHYSISVHTVGISIGSVEGIDRSHLRRVRSLIDRVDPFLVSGHLAWSTHAGEYLHDLLPLPYDDETLNLLAAHIDEVQEGLGRPYLVENPSSYVGFRTSTMTEVEFLNELVSRTGCQLLCDVSNIYLSAHNMGYDAEQYIDALPATAIGELHLGGFTPEDDEAQPGSTLLVDTHGTVVAEPAWNLYAYAIHRFGAKPTLIEWDNDIPPLATLLAQATRANEISSKALVGRRMHYAAAV